MLGFTKKESKSMGLVSYPAVGIKKERHECDAPDKNKPENNYSRENIFFNSSMARSVAQMSMCSSL